MTETAGLLRTRDELVAYMLRDQLRAERRVVRCLLDDRDSLRDDLRWWQFAFLLVTVQFAVMFIAAMWGWLR